MRWRAWLTFLAVSLLGRPPEDFGRLGQFSERILDIVAMPMPVELWIFFAESPAASQESTVLCLSSERDLMMSNGDRVVHWTLGYILKAPGHMTKTNMGLNSTTLHQSTVSNKRFPMISP